MKKDRGYLHRLQHSPYRNDICPVDFEQQLISSEFTKRRVILKRLESRWTLAVLTEQARALSHKAHDKQEMITKVSRQYSEWSRAMAQVISYFHEY